MWLSRNLASCNNRTSRAFIRHDLSHLQCKYHTELSTTKPVFNQYHTSSQSRWVPEHLLLAMLREAVGRLRKKPLFHKLWYYIITTFTLQSLLTHAPSKCNAMHVDRSFVTQSLANGQSLSLCYSEVGGRDYNYITCSNLSRNISISDTVRTG